MKYLDMLRPLSSIRIAQKVIGDSFSQNGSSGLRFLSIDRRKNQQIIINEGLESDWNFPHEDGHIVNTPFEPIKIPNITLDQFVWKDVNKWSNHTAIVGVFE